jgi:hypothetical protein
MDTVLKRPTREPWPPAQRAYAPAGTKEKAIVFEEREVMQSSPSINNGLKHRGGKSHNGRKRLVHSI